MRARFRAFVFVLTVSVFTTANAFAQPPKTGNATSTASKWMDAMNPAQWKWPTMPAMPWTAEKPRIQKKSPSVMSNMTKSAKTGWSKTKSALDPTQIFGSDSKAKKAPAKDSDKGIFGAMFKKEEPKEIHTVNDFLSQPHPR